MFTSKTFPWLFVTHIPLRSTKSLCRPWNRANAGSI